MSDAYTYLQVQCISIKTISLAIQAHKGFPCDSAVKNPPANARAAGDSGSIPGWGRSPGEGNGNYSSIPVWQSHAQRSLAGCSPWGHKRVRHDLATE